MTPTRPLVFLLSNGQRKELLVRGRELNIALPAPPEETPDPLIWAKSVLPAEIAALARAAEETVVWIRAIRDTPVTALGDHLGRIVADPTGELCAGVAAIVVTLRPVGCRQRAGTLVQWPARVLFRGQELPETPQPPPLELDR